MEAILMISSRTSLRILPAQHEPAYGIFNRLALRHKASNQMEFANQIGLGKSSVYDLNLGRKLQTLEKLTGVDELTIRRSTFQRDEYAGWHFGNEALAKVSNWGSASTVSYGRVCPACVREDMDERVGPVECRPYRRFWWDLAAIYACPIHNLFLIKSCAACRRPFGGDNLSLNRCSCGNKLTRKCYSAVPKDLLEVNRYIFGRLINENSSTIHILNELSIRNAIGILTKFGSQATLTSNRIVKTTDEIEKARIMTAGYEAFANWPTGFENALEKLVSDRAPNRISPKSAYGGMYRWLTANCDADLEQIRVALREHAIKRIPLKRNTKIFGAKLKGDITTLGDVATQCKCSSERAGTIAEALGLIGALPSRDRGNVVATEIAAPIKQFFESTLSREQVMKYLNISYDLFKKLLHVQIFCRAKRPTEK